MIWSVSCCAKPIARLFFIVIHQHAQLCQLITSRKISNRKTIHKKHKERLASRSSYIPSGSDRETRAELFCAILRVRVEPFVKISRGQSEKRVMVNGLTWLLYPIDSESARRTHGSSTVLGFSDPTQFPVVPGSVTVGEFVRSSWTKTPEKVVREGKYRPRRGPAPGRRQGPRCREEARQGKKSSLA